ncbi:phospholipase A [Luteimonas sp. SX5]|uniref:Phospholipase A1 n=1 Tax=Luteimonas galliterrae TaxID=2940486 RepID=A0ABT0MF21_9GAMM|nr:phospholipase A [Luteimonas galliterrae]MCL1633472.1 phospholipase A [Luteimonas galliterrae]
MTGRHRRSRRAIGTVFALFGVAAHAQNYQPGSPEACTAIASDAERLACYDTALQRQAPETQQADAAAAAASAELKAKQEARSSEPLTAKERARRAVDGLFGRDLVSSDADAIANAGKGSLLDRRWELAKDSKLGPFQLRAYKPVYLFPVFWTSNKNEMPQSPNPNNSVTEPEPLDPLEAKFQLSFKTKLAENLFGDNGDLWGGYTQSSRWQVYNSEISRPFRETDYEPEVMLVFRNNYSIGGWKGRMTGFQLTHQSNGRSDPLSRSWNRVILNFGFDRENWALTVRPWYRIPEDESDDNNPDIEDYVGRADATLVYNKGGHELALMARHSLRSGDRSHGAVQLDWGFPINNLLRGHVQVFDGYGESLIDYNHRATYIGLGISLLEWY